MLQRLYHLEMPQSREVSSQFLCSAYKKVCCPLRVHLDSIFLHPPMQPEAIRECVEKRRQQLHCLEQLWTDSHVQAISQQYREQFHLDTQDEYVYCICTIFNNYKPCLHESSNTDSTWIRLQCERPQPRL